MAQLVEHFTRNEGVVGSSPISSLYVGAAHCAAFCITGFTKGEYDMKITRQMLFPLAFYKKSKFNGSKGKYNYRIEKSDTEAEDSRFKLTIWEGPECYDASKAEKKESVYPFNDAGMEEILGVLNQL